MQEIKRINWFLLITVVISSVVSELGIMVYVENYGIRLLLSQLLFGVPMLSYLLIFRVPIKPAIGLGKIKFSNILLSILFYVLIKNLMTFLNALTMIFTKNSIGEVMLTVSNQVPFVVGIILIAVIPAVLEETVYRGIIYQGFRKADPMWAIIMSSLIFGLMHGNLNQFLYAFVLGAAFALLNEATGSIISSMVVHLITNLVSTVAIYVLSALSEMLVDMMSSSSGMADLLFGDMLKEFAASDGAAAGDNLKETLFSVQGTDILSMLPIYGFLAVGGTIGGFFVLRWIAKRNGRWEHIVWIFTHGKKGENRVSAVDEERGSSEASGVFSKELKCGRMSWIFTPQLLLALLILVYEMVFYELAVQGVV